MTTNTTQKAAGAINTNGLHADTNEADFRTGGAIGQAPDGKSIATQIARLAMAGHAVHQLPDGGFLVSKYSYIQQGNMKPVESMLYGQAQTLQAIFTNLSRRSALNVGQHIEAADKYMRLALKAQAQCRATLETLAIVKNPQPYIRQANIAHGPQQVNNRAPARAGETETQQNKLLEDNNGGTYLDTGAAPAAARSNPAVETLGAVDRAKKRRR